MYDPGRGRPMPWYEVEHRTSSGGVVKSWRQRVPRVPEDLIRSIVYIYPTEDAARANKPFGGTGFLVGMPGVTEEDWNASGSWTYYIVTAAHVVVGKGARVARINK